MFAHTYALFITLAVASSAFAAGVPKLPRPGLAAASKILSLAGRNLGGSNDCNTGSMHCCNTVGTSQASSASSMIGSLGGQLTGIDGVLGVECTPITGAASGGSQSCSAQPACCTKKSNNGALTLDCFPVNVTV